MNKLIIPHFSLEDWDFRPGNEFVLTPEHYVSPPTSLTGIHDGEGFSDDWFFLKAAIRSNIPHGKIRTAWWNTFGLQHLGSFFFRTQALPVNLYPDDGYYIYLYSTFADIRYRVGGESARLIKFDLANPPTVGQWSWWRVTWYTYIDMHLLNYTRIILEAWDGAEWVEQGFYDDGNNRWADSDVNLVGMRLRSYEPDYHNCLDDTEIWEAV